MRTPSPVSEALLALTAAALFPAPASAWSANGHRTVALIAESRLDDVTRKAVADILGPGATLDAIAPCADDVRVGSFDCSGIPLKAQPESEPWHFIDVPIAGPAPVDGAALETFCPNGACVVDRIRDAAKALQDPQALRDDKQAALMFLVHFAGDVHQPLHCAYGMFNGAPDRGGNAEAVKFGGAELKLHSLWDHQIRATDGENDPVAESRRLIADLQGKDVSGWLAGDFLSQAAIESFEIARSTGYPAYYAGTPGAILPSIVDERLEKAGVRLAEMLKVAVAPATMPAAPAPVPAKPRAARR